MAKLKSISFGVYLFDAKCKPLTVSGIAIELFNSTNNSRLNKQVSTQIGTTSEWGGILSWSPVSVPVEIVFTHSTYQYTGQAILDINGYVAGRLDVVLHKIPQKKGGQARSPASGSLTAISGWVQNGTKWTEEERLAVRTLIGNYYGFLLPRMAEGPDTTEIQDVKANWEKAMSVIGFDPSWLN